MTEPAEIRSDVNSFELGLGSLKFGALPAAVMFLGSATSYFFRPGDILQAACQRFSAGLLIGAIIADIFPLLRSHLSKKGANGAQEVNYHELISTTVGFLAGMLLMYGMGCMEGDEDSEDESASSDSDDLESTRRPSDASRGTGNGDGEQPDRVPRSRTAPAPRRVISGKSRGISGNFEANRLASFRRWQSGRVLNKEVFNHPSEHCHLPLQTIVAVTVDSAVDGMLVGMATAASAKSGMLLASATAIEMGFLGFSFCIELMLVTRRRWAAAISLIPPITICGAAYLAGVGAHELRDSSAFVGLLGFAMVAVLFMVIEELVLESNETADSWYVSCWMYVGLLLSIFLDVVG